MMLEMIQYPAMVMAILGAYLVTSPAVGVRRTAFGLWIAGNTLWVAWGLHAGAWGLVATYLVFTALAVAGYRRAKPGRGRVQG